MLKNNLLRFAAAVLLTAFALPGNAAVSEAQAARLGKDLTPLGGEKAGNEDGSIPEWTGGITKPPAGYKPGDHHPDPFAADKVLMKIDASNMAQYADELTAGEKALLTAYPDTYYMNIYPTRRSASAPQRIYDATRKIATTATLAEGGNGVNGAMHGIPFPIPSNGLEVIWNHILRWRALGGKRFYGQAAVTRSGEFTVVQFSDEIYVPYADPALTTEDLENVIIYFKDKTVAPARLAGRVLLVHETLDQAKENRKAWVYNPGQRRVRRAPNVAFDNPRSGSDGLMTSDQYDMFNGSPQRYNWELVGKREMYVPYNSYRVHQANLKYSDYLKPLHVDPQYLRYEKHRVWVVDSVLKADMRHQYKRRTFYIDEDSWQILAVDVYDNRDELWRVSEGHGINYYDVLNYWTTLETHYDLQSNRYIAFGLDNEASMYDLSYQPQKDEFTMSALRREGTR